MIRSAMPLPRRAIRKPAAVAKPQLQRRRRPVLPLNAEMPCDTAFRVIARDCLAALTARRQATCDGNTAALHDMRIALTRLRAAIAFFSPMAVDAEWPRWKRELKWLNARLGAARDVDVAIEQLDECRARQRDLISAAEYRSWQRKSTDTHRRLAQALQSDRYRRLINGTSRWIESGNWATANDKQAAKRRTCAIAPYCTVVLTRWRDKLLKKSAKLAEMGTKKRHRLRLANKRLRYSVEFFTALLANSGPTVRDTLKQLRKAQAALGELNDGSQGETLAASLPRHAASPAKARFLDGKREKQLVRVAGRAYRKLAELEPLRT